MNNDREKASYNHGPILSDASGGAGNTNITPDACSSDEGSTRFFTVDDWNSFVGGVEIIYPVEKPRILLVLSHVADTDSQRIADLLSLADTIGIYEPNAES